MENCYLYIYADDNTYVFDCNMTLVKRKRYWDFDVLNAWLFDNYMTLIPGNCSFMCLGSNLSVGEILCI